MKKPFSLSIHNNHNGTWTVHVSFLVPETQEYYKAPLMTSSDFQACQRLFNLNWSGEPEVSNG